MTLLTDAQQRQHAIVHSGEVAKQIDEPVATRRDADLELLVGELREGCFDAIDVELPRAEGAVDEELFCCHGSGTLGEYATKASVARIEVARRSGNILSTSGAGRKDTWMRRHVALSVIRLPHL